MTGWSPRKLTERTHQSSVSATHVSCPKRGTAEVLSAAQSLKTKQPARTPPSTLLFLVFTCQTAYNIAASVMAYTTKQNDPPIEDEAESHNDVLRGTAELSSKCERKEFL